MSDKNKKIVTSYAPAPKPWQNRVLHTLQDVVQHALAQELNNAQEEFFLWQWILSAWVEEKITQEMLDNHCDGNKVMAQDLAVWKYLSWALGDPLQDAKGLMNRFYELVCKLNFSYIKNNHNSLSSGEVFGKFVFVRHWEKAWDGNLSENGKKQAQDAGKFIKEKYSDMMPNWYFAGQQPIPQMTMMALLAWKMEEKKIKTSQYIWDNYMPSEWKEPYQTAEITTYELLLGDFDDKSFDLMKDNEQNDYLNEKVILTVERRGVKKQFILSDILRYLSSFS